MMNYLCLMTEPDPTKLTLADPKDLSDTLSFALRFEGKKRYHDSDRFAADCLASAPLRRIRGFQEGRISGSS